MGVGVEAGGGGVSDMCGIVGAQRAQAKTSLSVEAASCVHTGGVPTLFRKAIQI